MNDKEEQRRLRLHAALLEVLDEAMKIHEAACGKIRVYDPESQRLEICAQRGFSDSFVRSFEAIAASEALPSARAFRLRHRVSVPDVTADPLLAPLVEPARREGFRAIQATPVVGSDGRVIGTLSTHFARVHHPTTAEGLQLDYLSRKAATLIEALAPAK